MVLERKETTISKTTERSSDAWCEAIRSKIQRGVDGHVGYRGVLG